ncbi:oxidoreductase family protein [Lactobacillus pasteurii DSM 23907 = CRBIP 24.76]|nr:oxidoreductase family protein [Lactobacillus pasteurii DSM 23907 = CRBIP 24.76]
MRTIMALTWGIIGTGGIAHRFAGNMKMSGTKMVGVAARNFEKTKKFAQEYGIEQAYEAVDEMLANEQIQAIYIATTNNTHVDFIKQALLAGKHVLCEKPMAINTKQFDECAALAKKQGLILEEAFTPFHMPVMKKLREIVDSGVISDIKLIEADFCENIGELNDDSRMLNPKLGGGALLDIGCYPICFASLFMDEIEDISAVCQKQNGVDVASSVVLNDGKRLASLSSSFLTSLPRDAVLSGTKGNIVVEHFSRSEKFIVDVDGQKQEYVVGDSEQAWNYEVADFNRYVEVGHDDGELEQSRKIVQIMDQIRDKWQLVYPFE